MSTNPSKNKWKNVMRRASMLSISRGDKDKDKERSDSDSAPSKSATPPLSTPTHVPPVPSKPSPIAESPAREAAASQELPPVGPSPLSRSLAEQNLAPPQRDSPASSDYGSGAYVHPPLIDSNVAGLGPGAFTDELDDLPQHQSIRDPSIRDPSIRHPDSADGHGSSAPSQTHTVEDRASAVYEPTRETSVSYFDRPVVNTPEPEPVSHASRPQTSREPTWDNQSIRTTDSVPKPQTTTVTDQRDLRQTMAHPAGATAESLTLPVPFSDKKKAPERGVSPRPSRSTLIPAPSSTMVPNRSPAPSSIGIPVSSPVVQPPTPNAPNAPGFGSAQQALSQMGPSFPASHQAPTPQQPAVPSTPSSGPAPSVPLAPAPAPTYSPQTPPPQGPVYPQIVPLQQSSTLPVQTYTPPPPQTALSTTTNFAQTQRQSTQTYVSPPIPTSAPPGVRQFELPPATTIPVMLPPQVTSQPQPVPVPYEVVNHNVWAAPPQVAVAKPTDQHRGLSAGTPAQQQPITMPEPMHNPFADFPPQTTAPASKPLQMPSAPGHGPEPFIADRSTGTGSRVVLPLPSLEEVIPSRKPHRTASLESTATISRTNRDTDETRPLLSQQNSLKQSTYLLGTPASKAHRVFISPQEPATWASQAPALPRLRDLGWLEYFLPDGAVYFIHPTQRIVTEIDLYNSKRLDSVSNFLDRYLSSEVPQGYELWLRENIPATGAPVSKKGGNVTALWINHNKRAVTFTPPSDMPSDRRMRGPVVAEDHLDQEYRYWLFVEAHPAHSSIPRTARKEAMDALTWAWTDRLLPSDRLLPPPFTEAECQELIGLFRTSQDHAEEAIQSLVQTRVVARALLRVVQWRQTHHRPKKPLPHDVGMGPMPPPKRQRPARKSFFDFVISCICLGLPYIFFERHRLHRYDEESGFRQSAPLFVIGACTCLVAAIVLSASVTFLSLPGLDDIARIAVVIAVILASFSLASTIFSILKFKANSVRHTAQVNVSEGFLSLSGRSIVHSLPLVFLSYSIISFTTAIVLFSMQGVIIKDPINGHWELDDLSRWAIIGLLGGLAGIITSAAFLLRK